MPDTEGANLIFLLGEIARLVTISYGSYIVFTILRFIRFIPLKTFYIFNQFFFGVRLIVEIIRR